MSKEILVPIYNQSAIREEDKGKFIERTEVSLRLLRNLHLNQIYTLEDVLNIPYTNLKMIRNFGKQSLDELKNYVHSFGYFLLGEEVPLEEARTLGVPLLEDFGFSEEICFLFYSRKIFTLEDLNLHFEKLNSREIQKILKRTRKK